MESFAGRVSLVLVFAVLSFLVGARGFYITFKEPRGRMFILAFLIHMAVYFGVEAAVGMLTFFKVKMFFLIMPVLFIFLARGFCELGGFLGLRKFLFWIICVALLANSTACVWGRPRLGGPYRYVEVLPVRVNNLVGAEDKGLVIIGTTARKQLFDFIYAINVAVDVKILPPGGKEFSSAQLENLENYDYVFIANIDIPGESKPLSEEKVKMISEHITGHGFSQVSRSETFYKSRPTSLFVFSKTD